jgi:hypothetical protein
MGSGSGLRRLMYMAGLVVLEVWMVSGLTDRAQDVGQRVNARVEHVQSSSGLWALSQSVPSMTSWVPTTVT